MQIVLTLLPDDTAVRRLRRAMQFRNATGPNWQLCQIEDWPAMHLAAREAGPTLVIADPHASGALDVASLAKFRSAFPSVPLLPYGSFHGRIRDVMRLAAGGMAEVVVRDQDDAPAEFARLIDAAAAQCLSATVLEELGPLVPLRLAELVRYLLSTPEPCPDPASVAKLYFRHRNTLREHLRAAGLPPVNKLIVWTRLFRAAHLLADASRTVEAAALALSFGSPSALRNQLQRYAAMTPQQVRAGGVAGVVEQFRNRHRAGAWDVALMPPHPAGHRSRGAAQ